MRRLRLTEYARSTLHGVSREEAALLRRTVPSLRIEPCLDSTEGFDAIPGSWVGAVSLPGLEVQIHPKLPIDRLMFLISYAADPAAWKEDVVELSEADSPLDAVAAAFLRLAAAATRRGLLHGYRSIEDALQTVRGRIRFGEIVQRRRGVLLPVDVRYDEFTADIPENQLLRAALLRLGRARLRSPKVARGLREVAAAFSEVSNLQIRPREVALPLITRLNKHYEPALRLAALILRGGSFELGDGSATGSAFLLDMNDVFEAFVHRSLCEALGVSADEFRRGPSGLHLDEARRVRVEPDLTWWRAGRCVFVGDAKYKRLEAAGFKHADLYQLLAYTTALDLPHGMLIYAASEAAPASHRVRHAGKWLEIAALDLAGTPIAMLECVRAIARRIEAQSAHHSHPTLALP